MEKRLDRVAALESAMQQMQERQEALERARHEQEAIIAELRVRLDHLAPPLSPAPRWQRATATLLGLAVLALTVLCAQRAYATVLVPNALIRSFSLAPNADSTPITPPPNQPVLVMGVCTTLNYRGVGQVSLLRVPGAFLVWTGIHSPYVASIASDAASAPGTDIVGINWDHTVVLAVHDADSFHVHNGSSAARTGQVLTIW